MSTSEERLGTGILNGHKPKTIRETAYRLIDEGFFPTILYPAGIVVPPKTEPEEGKRPMRKGWGLERITYAIVDECLKRYRKAGVGLCLGPGKGPGGRWLVDIEGDGPEAKASSAKLFGEDASGSLGWGSARGGHELRFGDEDRLGAILQALAPRGKDAKGQEPGVLHLPELPDLELRLGMPGKQLQSACPPTRGTDGRPRQWNDCPAIEELPESFYAFLEGIARDREKAAAASNGKHQSNGQHQDKGRKRGVWTVGAGLADPVAAYFAKAIGEEIDRVRQATAEAHNRHDTLRSASYTLAGLRWCQDFDWPATRKALEDAGSKIGLPDQEVKELLDGAEDRTDERRPDGLLDAIARRERERQEQERRDRTGEDGQGAEPPPPPESDVDGNATVLGIPIDVLLSAYPWTDLGNAERLVFRYGRQNLRFCHPWGKWLAWDGCRWAIDNTARARRWAKSTVRKMLREAEAIEDDKVRKAFLQYQASCESKGRIDAMLGLASSEASIPILPEEMDPDPWLFNCPNGTLDLKTGELRPHDRWDRITKLCPVEYDKAAKCPQWLATLGKFFRGNVDLIDYWQRICGYALCGVVRDHIIPIAYGTGSNGKSTILGALLEVLGPDYAMKCPPDLLMAKQNDSHPTDRADLFGKRLVVAIETESGRRLNETMVKELTGGDRIRARRMREDFWEFAPTHTVIMATNHKPKVRGTDNGIWRRLRLVPFTVSVKGEDADKEMPEKLRKELPGILAWCVEGCQKWQEKKGLDEPEAVSEATDGYRKEQDIIGAFLDEFAVEHPNAKVKAGALYARYKQWAESGNEFVLSQTAFGVAVEERGIEKKTSNGVWYIGIGLRYSGDSAKEGQTEGADPGKGTQRVEDDV